MTKSRDTADSINRIDSSAADATAITIDSSENVGIGVTPEGWGSVFQPVLRVGLGGAVFGSTATNFRITSNVYYDSAYKYIANGGAAQYEQDGGAHLWYTAPSGSADGALTLTERMRMNSSGIVGIGTTSPQGSGLHIKAPDANTGLVLSGTTATAGTEVLFSALNEATTAWHSLNIGSHETIFRTSGAERMRISATSPALSIGKTTFGTAGQGYTVYGNTVPQCYFNKSQSGAVNGILFYHADSYVGGLNYDNTNTSLATSSDERLKDNIENSDDAGAKIDAMRVRQFDWKSTGEHQEYGFVAQELEPVFAHAVHTDKEGDYKSVDYACLVPMLVKEIQSLRQRITDLENA